MEVIKANILKKSLLACRRALLYVAIFSFVINILMLTVALYMFQIFDRVFASHSYDTLIYLTLIAVFALGILGSLDYLRSRILLFTSHWLDKEISPEALNRSADNILQGGSYAPQALKDITSIRGFISGYGMMSILDLPWVPIYLLAIFMINPILGLLGIVATFFLFSLAIFNEMVTREISTQMNSKILNTQHRLSATLHNAETIQAMGMLPAVMTKWFKENQEILNLQAKMNQKNGKIVAFSKFLRLTIQIFILGLGAYFVINNKLTAGGMIAASIILGRALAPIEQSISVWNQFMTVREAYRRLEAYLAQPLRRTAETVLPRPKGNISVENVSFIPPATKNTVLRNINFEIKAGETLAIVGPSAAGKTTLARLLAGIYPPSMGTIRLDGAEVFTWDRSQFGPYLGYLPQIIELFMGTVKENIARMKKGNDEDIVRAAIRAGAHEMVLSLPSGYETIATESANNLSAGQRQRIAFARSLYGDPVVVILDEPNSNLDTEGEIALVRAIMELKKSGLTVIFIAHSPQLLRLSDKILFLQEGKMVAFGPTLEVMEKLKAEQEKRQMAGRKPESEPGSGQGSNHDSERDSEKGSQET